MRKGRGAGASDSGRSPVLGVLEVEAASGIPLRTLVAVSRDAASVLEHPGNVGLSSGEGFNVPFTYSALRSS